MKTGKLITFEGIDGSGKTTQLQRLGTFLREAGYDVLTTREPGGTPLGRQIRQALLDGESGSVDPLAELLLYAADRAQHVRQLIRPALLAGRIVLCDRFCDATVAYQGYGRGFPIDLIIQLNQLATDGLTPDLTLFYDLPVEEGLARTRGRQTAGAPGRENQADRLDREPLDFHRRVREGYHFLVNSAAVRAELPDVELSRFRVVPAGGSIEEVFIRTRREALAVVAPARG